MLDFSEFKFLTADTVHGVNRHHSAKFRVDRSDRGRNIAVFRFFRMVTIRHLGFLKV